MNLPQITTPAVVTAFNNAMFDKRMALEIAFGLEPAESIRQRYGLSDDDWDRLRDMPAFRNCIAAYLAELQKTGASFRMKAQTLAEDVLKVAHVLAAREDVPSAVRLAAVQWLAKVSGFDESAKKDGVGTGTAVQVNINLGGRTVTYE